MTKFRSIATRYSRFAEFEAAGRSKLYFEFANRIARDDEFLAVLSTLPRPKQQPNLLFAAYKYRFGVPLNWHAFRRQFLEAQDKIVDEVMARRTQTNEPARCATLFPLLATLGRPLALLELGASAGLCLIPDRYAYEYGDCHIDAIGNPSQLPLLRCRANAKTPIPTAPLGIVWRLGLDVEPVSLTDADGVAWLEACIWPDEGERLRIFREAVKTARQEPPSVFRHDIREDLSQYIVDVPREATLVVFHSAVLAYLSPAERDQIATNVRKLDAIWICNESPEVLPLGYTPEKVNRDDFLLRCDGEPIAWADGHGTQIDWL